MNFIFIYRALFRFICLNWKVHSYQRKNISVGEVFQQNVAKHPSKPCVIFEDEEWTFAQV